MLDVVASMAEDYKSCWTMSLDKMKHHSFASSRADRSRYSHQNNLLLVDSSVSSKVPLLTLPNGGSIEFAAAAAATMMPKPQQNSQNLANLVDVRIVDDSGDLSNMNGGDALRKSKNEREVPGSVDNHLSDVPFSEKEIPLTGKSGQGTSKQHNTSLQKYALSSTSQIEDGVNTPIHNHQQIPFLESHSLDESSRSVNIEFKAKEVQKPLSLTNGDSPKHSELSGDGENVKESDMYPYPGYPYVAGYPPPVRVPTLSPPPSVPPPLIVPPPPVYNARNFVQSPGSYQHNPYVYNNNSYVDPRLLQYSAYNQYVNNNPPVIHHQSVENANISKTVHNQSEVAQLNHVNNSPTQFHPSQVPLLPGQIEMTEQTTFIHNSVTYSTTQKQHQQIENHKTLVQNHPAQNSAVAATPMSPPSDSTPDLSWCPNPSTLILVSPNHEGQDVNSNKENLKNNHGQTVDSSELGAITNFTSSSREEKQTLKKQKGMSHSGESSDDEDGLINMMKKIQKKLPKESRTSCREKSPVQKVETARKSSGISEEKNDNDDVLTEEQKMFWAKLLSKPGKNSKKVRDRKESTLESPLSPERNDSVEGGFVVRRVDVTIDETYMPPNYQELREDPRIIKRAEKLGLPLSKYDSSEPRSSEETEAFSSTEDDDVEKMLIISEIQEENNNIPVIETAGDDLFPPVEGTFLPNYEPNSTDLKSVIRDPEESIDILEIVEAQYRKAQMEAQKDRQAQLSIGNDTPKEPENDLIKLSSSSEFSSRASSSLDGSSPKSDGSSSRENKKSKVKKISVGGCSADKKNAEKRKHNAKDDKKTSSSHDQPPSKKKKDHHHVKTASLSSAKVIVDSKSKVTAAVLSSKREGVTAHKHENSKLKSLPATKEPVKNCKSKSIRKKPYDAPKKSTEAHSDKSKKISKNKHRTHSRDSSSSSRSKTDESSTSNGRPANLPEPDLKINAPASSNDLEDVSSSESFFELSSTPPREKRPKTEDRKLDAKKTESKSSDEACSRSSEGTSVTNVKAKKPTEQIKDAKKKHHVSSPVVQNKSHKKTHKSSSCKHSDPNTAVKNEQKKHEDKVADLMNKFVYNKSYLKENKQKSTAKRGGSPPKKDAEIAKKQKLPQKDPVQSKSPEKYDSEDDFDISPAKKILSQKKCNDSTEDDSDCVILSSDESIVLSQQCVPSEETIVEKKRSDDSVLQNPTQMISAEEETSGMNESNEDRLIHDLPPKEIAVTGAISKKTSEEIIIASPPHSGATETSATDTPYRATKVKIVRNDSLKKVFAAMDPTSSPFL